MGTLYAVRPCRKGRYPQGQDFSRAFRIRLCGIPNRGGRRLLHQDHAHDQAVREAHQGEQGGPGQENAGGWGEYLHRKFGSGGG